MEETRRTRCETHSDSIHVSLHEKGLFSEAVLHSGELYQPSGGTVKDTRSGP